MKRVAAVVAALALAFGLSACASDADVASKNLSKDADNFKVLRRVVFYDGINASYLLEIQGYCSLGNSDDAGQLSVTCKVGPDQYKKHFLGLSDNVTYVVEQLEARDVSTQRYKVIFKPSVIVPDIEIR